MQRADAHRAFSEQLAHELRTPLSRLSSSLPDDGSDDGDEATGTVRARILEVSQALGDMLELASIRNDAINMESGMGSRTLQPGSPAEIVREVAEMFEDVADEAGVTLSVHAQEKTRLPLDAGQFRRLCVNLIDNALQHAPSGHPVEIAVQPTEKTILRVSNPGQFPAKLTEAGPQRFETFGQDGTGLGLAFADAIAGYHGWSLHLSNQDGHAVASVEAA